MTHDDAEFTNPPARRLGALAVIRTEGDKVLLVEKGYLTRNRWGLPGGCVRPDEPAEAACQREVAEETGLHVVPGRVLALHHMPAVGKAREGLNIIFDGGKIPPDTEIRLEPNLLSYQWADLSDLSDLVAPYTAYRIATALEALREGRGVSYLLGTKAT